MPDWVECRSDFTYAQRPVALRWDDRRLEVEAVIAEWRLPDGRYFRVRAAGGQLFELSYVEAFDRWQIVPLGTVDEGRTTGA